MPIKKNNNAKNREKTYSVADILMVVGFVVLAFTTYLGSKLLTGDITRAIITTVLIIGLSGLLLWLLCVAKKAQNHRQAWMMVEGISLLAFIGVFLFVFAGESRHFQYISANKAELHQKALADQKIIMDLFDRYEKTENEDISRIYNSIKALPANQTLYADKDTRARLEEWAGNKAIKSGHSYSRSFINKAAMDYQDVLKEALVGTSYNDLKKGYKEKLDKVVKSLGEGSDYGEYYNMARELPVQYAKIAEKLNGFSSKPQKYELSYNGKILKSSLLPRKYDVDKEELNLPAYFNGEKKSTAAGWLMSTGMLIFILCAYFATRRSRRVTVLSNGILGRKKNYTNDGGIDLC